MDKDFNYEDNIAKLTEILNNLTNNKMSIDDSVKAYESAEKIYQDCKKYLDEQTGKILVIRKNLENFVEEEID